VQDRPVVATQAGEQVTRFGVGERPRKLTFRPNRSRVSDRVQRHRTVSDGRAASARQGAACGAGGVRCMTGGDGIKGALNHRNPQLGYPQLAERRYDIQADGRAVQGAGSCCQIRMFHFGEPQFGRVAGPISLSPTHVQSRSARRSRSSASPREAPHRVTGRRTRRCGRMCRLVEEVCPMTAA
jgi:hypothetical protein